jgi:hypothetical protein
MIVWTLFRRTRYHYKFVGVTADWESISRQFKTSIYTFRGEGSSGQKNLHSTPVEDRSGGRRPDCLTATSEVRGEAARNWSPASNLFEFWKTGNLYQPSWRGRGGGPGSRLANAGQILRAARRQLIAGRASTLENCLKLAILCWGLQYIDWSVRSTAWGTASTQNESTNWWSPGGGETGSKI